MGFGDTIKDPGTGRDVSVCDKDCEFRSCLWVREDPGSYAKGRGYRYDGPKVRPLLCGTREANGCPTPLPAPDPERARCCPAPDLPKPSPKSPPIKQTCRRCRTVHRGRRRLELVRGLEQRPFSKCSHEPTVQNGVQRQGLKHDSGTQWSPGYWTCARCAVYWNDGPKPDRHAGGEGAEEFWGRRKVEAEARAQGTTTPGSPRPADSGTGGAPRPTTPADS